MPATGPNALPRVATEEAAGAVAAQGVRVSVVRLPPTVHGEGVHGFIPLLIGIARDKGFSASGGDGTNRWAVVHRLDAAHFYRLVLENDFSAGARFHGVAEEGMPFRNIAEVIGRRLNVRVVSKAPEHAVEHFGWFALYAAADVPASSQQTRELLGWQPTQPGLIRNIDRPSHFGGEKSWPNNA